MKRIRLALSSFFRADRDAVEAARAQLAAISADLDKRLDRVIDRLAKHDPGSAPEKAAP